MKRKTGDINRNRRMRVRIAQKAARLMCEHGIQDYYQAKQKAAAQLGVADTGNLPRNDEIEAARVEYQRLFRHQEQARHLRHLREIALQTMRLLARFDPHLVGPVLNGSAGRYDAVTLHLFADTPEEIAFTLMERAIPFRPREYHLRFNGHPRTFPGYRFMSGETDIELVIFPANAFHHAPSSPVDGRPMRRMSRPKLERLLAEGREPADPPF